MKKVRLFLLLLMVAMLPLAMQAQKALPYEYGFENNDLAGEGWTMVDCTVGSNSSTGIATAAAKNGDYGFMFYYNTNPPQYLISPELTGTEAGLTVEFYYVNGSTYNETFKVGYSTTDNDVASFTWGTELTAPSDWELYSGSFPAGTKFVAIQYTANDQFKMYLDDFSFSGPVSCPNPTDLAYSNVTTTSADLSWTAVGSETAWTLEVNGTTRTGITENPYTLTDLTPGTAYTVKVKANCSDEEQSSWSTPVNFVTVCAEVTIDDEHNYTEDFEVYDGNSFPDCWTLDIPYATSYSSYPYVIENTSYSTYSHGGTKAMYMYAYGTGTSNLISTPTFSNEMNTLQVTFFAKYSSNNPVFEVGVMDGNTFDPVETITLTSSYPSNAYTVMFNNYTGNGNRIAFRLTPSGTSSYSSYYVYLDDVVVDFVPSCLAPSAVTVVDGSVAATTATISWNDNNNVAPENNWVILLNGEEVSADENPFTLTELTPETSYTVKVKAACSETDSSEWSIGTASFTTLPSCPAPTALTVVENSVTTNGAQISWTAGGEEEAWIVNLNGTDIDVTENPYTFDELTPATSYTVKVKAVCSETDSSHWSNTVNFTTECVTFVVTEENPFVENFDNNGICWTPDDYVTGNTNWQIVSAISDGGSLTTLFDGACAKFYSTTAAQKTKAISPVLDLSALTNARLTFQMANPAWGSDVDRLKLYYRVAEDAEWVEIDSIGDAHGEWTPMSYTLPVTSATFQIAFEGSNNTGYNYGYAIFVDDVTVEETPACLAPTNLALDTVTTTYFQVSWTDNNEATPASWTVAYSIDGGENFIEIADIDHTTDVVCNFDAPTGDANVIVKVKANCDSENESSWSNSINFVTPPTCPAPTALEYSAVMNNSVTLNWTAGGEETQWIVEVNGNETDAVSENPLTIDTLTAETNYRIRVRAFCGEGDSSVWSNTVTFYTGTCVPAPTSVDNSGITNVTFGQTQIVNNNTHPTGQPFYGNYTDQVGDGAITTNVTVNVTYATGYTYGTVIWVNWNNDVEFTDDEVVFAGTSESTNPTTLSCTFTIPFGTPVGEYRMRIGAADNQFDAAITSNSGYNPCLSTTYTIYEDYTLSVTEAPSCMAPSNVTVSDITATTATISWEDNNTPAAESWIISLNGTDTMVNENPFTFDNLIEQTPYIVIVRSLCTDEDTSFNSNTARFVTPCAPISAEGYNENFANCTANTSATTSGSMPTCWNYIYEGSNSGAEPHVYNGYSAITSNDNCLIITAGFYEGWYYDYDYGVTNYAIMPAFTDLTGKQINFTYKTAASGILALGYLTDIRDAETFVELETIPNSTAAANFDINVTSVPANARLAFSWKYSATDYYYSCYIDDITITDLPTCRKPTALTITDITTTSATIDWTDNNETAPQSWTISLNEMDTTVTEHPFTIDNLSASTLYTVKVKANCDDTDMSEWSSEETLATDCDIASAENYEETFSGYAAVSYSYSTGGVLPLCWSYIYTGQEDGGEPHIINNSSYGVTYGDNCLALVAGMYEDEYGYYGDEDYGVTNYAIMPEFDNLEGKQMAFSYKTASTGTLMVGYLTNSEDASTFVELATVPASTAAADYEVLVNTVPTGARLAFAWNCTSTSYYYSCYIDNVVIEDIPTCVRPTNLNISSITGTSVTIDWTDNNMTAPQSWTIELNNIDTTVTEHPFTIDNLASSTHYTVKVKANCTDDDESAWSVEETFNTLCEGVIVITPTNSYQEGFEDATDFGCWSTQIITGTTDWTHNATAAVGSYSAYFNYGGGESYLISPVFDLTQAPSAQLTFQHRQPEWTGDPASELYVYYRANASDEWSQLASYTTFFENFTTETFTLPNPSATYQISFKAVGAGGYSVYLDDVNIFVGEAPTCATPTNVAVENGVVTWTGDAANYNVHIVAGETVIDTTVNTNSYTIDGLNEGDHATVSVQAVCSEDNLSEWSEAVEFDYTTVGIHNYGINANIYPNPTTGNVTVESNAINADITVYDMFGKLMMTSKVAAERTELDFSGFAPGVYMVRIANSNAITTVKVVKE